MFELLSWSQLTVIFLFTWGLEVCLCGEVRMRQPCQNQACCSFHTTLAIERESVLSVRGKQIGLKSRKYLEMDSCCRPSYACLSVCLFVCMCVYVSPFFMYPCLSYSCVHFVWLHACLWTWLSCSVCFFLLFVGVYGRVIVYTLCNTCVRVWVCVYAFCVWMQLLHQNR